VIFRENNKANETTNTGKRPLDPSPPDGVKGRFAGFIQLTKLGERFFWIFYSRDENRFSNSSENRLEAQRILPCDLVSEALPDAGHTFVCLRSLMSVLRIAIF